MSDTPPPKIGQTDSDKINVLVVDDSAIIRGLITRMIENEPDLTVRDSAANGKIAVSKVEKGNIDVVILDIDMPVMDGLTALPQIIEASPDTHVIMASTLTTRNAVTSLRAMELGAADYVPKPTSNREISGAGMSGDEFQRELVEKVRALGGQRLRSRGRAAVLDRAASGSADLDATGAIRTAVKAAAPITTSQNELPRHPRILPRRRLQESGARVAS